MLGTVNRQVLHPAIRMIDQITGMEQQAGEGGLLQLIHHEVDTGGAGQLSSDDPPKQYLNTVGPNDMLIKVFPIKMRESLKLVMI